MKKVSVLILLIVIIGAIFYFWQNKNNAVSDNMENTDYAWTVNFQFSDNENSVLELDSPEALTLSTITEMITADQNWDYEYEDYDDMGILVTKIGDKKNGENQKYWQYFVAGEQPQISVDKYMPESGTYIEWKFQESEL